MAVAVAVEEDAGVLTLSAVVGLNPLAPAGSLVDGAKEAPAAILDVGAVVLAHDGLDGLGGLVGVVEGDGGDVVVEDVGLDDTVEDLAADEAELAVNGSGGATGEVPVLAGVVREGGVGVLEVGDGDCEEIVSCVGDKGEVLKNAYRASGGPRTRERCTKRRQPGSRRSCQRE